MKFLLTICLFVISIAPSASAQQRAFLTQKQIREVEQRLAGLGYWTGAIDGRFDLATQSALIAFQKWEGRPITGRLTVDELKAIRLSERPKPRETGYEHVEVDLDRQVLMIVDEEERIRVLPVSTGSGQPFVSDGQTSIAYTPRGRFVVYDKTYGWEDGALGSVYYANYITGGVAIHGYTSVPIQPASHGCIRIPMFAAREVSKLLALGTIVLVYDRISFVSAKDWASNPKLKEAAMLNGAAKDYTHHAATAEAVLFDDFSYANNQQLKKNGWILRTEAGWPGVPGATWAEQGVSIVRDPSNPANRIVRMTSSTDGTPANTTQTQICHQRKYREGTYAARVRFTDNPVSGPGGDQIVQAFYTISPLKAPMDLDYSELDFEYLPNGGWGINGPTLYATTWETFSPEPNWKKDNVFKTANGSQAGWHTLVTQVANEKVRYFVDGKLFAEHGGEYYPEDTMSINFNLWFIRDGMIKAGERRQYQDEIDWVFHQANVSLTPEQVEAAVAAMRRKSVKFRDTVPAKVPALISPCNL